MRVASALGCFLLVAAVHAQDSPVKPEVQNAADLPISDASITMAQRQSAANQPMSDAPLSKVNAGALPDKPQPIAHEGEWLNEGDAMPKFPNDLVMAAERSEGRMKWHIREVNSCVSCGAPMTWRQAMFDKKASTMWGLRSALVAADIELMHHMPCFQGGSCRDGNPLLGQSRLQAYAVGEGLNMVAWIGTAWGRKGDLNNHIGGYRRWWIVPIIGYAASGTSIIMHLATWNNR